MSTMNFYQRFKLDKQLADNINFNPYYCEIQSGLEDTVIIDGHEFINLASNNYLGLAADPAVKEAAMEAVKKYGTSLCGTPAATGYTELYKRVENKISSFVGLEGTVILPSCYQANNGLFTLVAGKDDIVVVDRSAHSSLIQGIKGAGCKIRPFLHNNMEHLESILKNSSGFRQIFIVTESVFSTDGTIAPLSDIIKLADEYDAFPVVDDSHGIGVIGSTGRGILEEAGIRDFRGIYTASLGKALANSGGIISGKKELIEYFKYYCPQLVYSTALSPASLGGIEKVLEVIETGFDAISRKLWHNKELISRCLIEAGFRVSDSRAAINSIISGSASDTLLLAKRFYEKGILATPFIEPSVPPKEGRLRLIAGANLKEETMARAADIIRKLGRPQ
ncbi:MAG: aminotransferase [Clostridia bacterium BRH_c25]|nr:MAG: aminotransferase [Clostridia bacterium BRH_c25]